MKTKITFYLIFAIIFVLIPSVVTSQLNYTKVLNINKPLSYIVFPTPDKGFIYGPNIRYTTTDGGINWKYSLNENNLGIYPHNSVFFIDSLTGWATQNNWDLMKTTDGGNTWVNSPIGIPLYLNSVYFTDPNNGWTGGLSGADLLRTSNGGLTWSRINTGGSSGYVVSICFPNVNNGFVNFTNSDIFAATTDGGFTWVRKQINYFHSPYKFFFVNSQTGWIIGYNSIVRTTNGGINWDLHSINWDRANNIYFIDSLLGWVVADYGRIWKTTNGGISWTNQRPNFTDLNYDLKSVYFKNANSGFVVGSDGNVISTTNGGSNWIPSHEFKDEAIKSVNFIDNLTGWICTNGTIRKSTNSGYNWVTKFVSSNSINSIKFADHNTGCAVGSNNIFSTTNAGENWSQQASPVNLTSIYFLSSSIAWICGNNGTILKTTNGGINWINQISNTVQDFTSITAVDENNCYCVGGGNIVLSTRDGGNTWNGSTLSDKIHESIYFTSKNTGYIISNLIHPDLYPYTDNVIFKTTDSGSNWNQIYSLTEQGTYKFTKISFSDHINGIVLKNNGRYGKFLTTANAGSNWLYPNLPVEYVNFLDVSNKNNYGWIVGSNATIITSSNNIVGINEISIELPITFSLSQNYPNPFNPKTKLEFGISDLGFVSLKVFNMLGKEVATLVNEKLNPGNYSVEFNGEGLPSGVYFYKLETSDFFETKRMVLLK